MRPVVLVHGAWHGAWCWAALQAELDRRGVASYAVDLPGHGASTLPAGDMYGDADHVVATLRALSGLGAPVLVGHSYAGAVITEAAIRSDVAIDHLVYVAAFALDEGESVFDVVNNVAGGPVRLSEAMQSDGAGSFVLDGGDATRQALYGASPPDVVAAALARLDVQPATGSPRAELGSTYVVCNGDDAVHPQQQAAMAERCGARVTLDSDHSPFLSAIPALADVIEGRARA